VTSREWLLALKLHYLRHDDKKALNKILPTTQSPYFISTSLSLRSERILPITQAGRTFSSILTFYEKILFDLNPRCVHILNMHIEFSDTHTHEFITNICPSPNIGISDGRGVSCIFPYTYVHKCIMCVTGLITFAVGFETDVHSY
jgi:hypothetical protein